LSTTFRRTQEITTTFLIITITHTPIFQESTTNIVACIAISNFVGVDARPFAAALVIAVIGIAFTESLVAAYAVGTISTTTAISRIRTRFLSIRKATGVKFYVWINNV
jgi:hypothetical protein